MLRLLLIVVIGVGVQFAVNIIIIFLILLMFLMTGDIGVSFPLSPFGASIRGRSFNYVCAIF